MNNNSNDNQQVASGQISAAGGQETAQQAADRNRQPTRTTTTIGAVAANHISEIEDISDDQPNLAPINTNDVSTCRDTIASLLRLNAQEIQTYTTTCGFTQASITSGAEIVDKQLDNSATCFFNDCHCTKYVENGFCSVHANLRICRPITEYEGNCGRIIHVPMCDISNRQIVRIFPLLSYANRLTPEDLQILYHPDAKVLTDAVNYLVGVTTQIGDADHNDEKTEYIKKIIQFRDSHRQHLLRLTAFISKVNVYMYFSSAYEPTNEKVRGWFNSAQTITGTTVKVCRINLLDIDNIMDIYNISLYYPAKRILENGSEVAQIPDVIIVDGYICYGAGFGQSRFVQPDKTAPIPPTYRLHSTEHLAYARSVTTMRVSPLTIDVESRTGSAILVTLDLKRQQTLTTVANVPKHNVSQFRLPAITNVPSLTYGC